jgi:copper chaperone CopZ
MAYDPKKNVVVMKAEADGGLNLITTRYNGGEGVVKLTRIRNEKKVKLGTLNAAELTFIVDQSKKAIPKLQSIAKEVAKAKEVAAVKIEVDKKAAKAKADKAKADKKAAKDAEKAKAKKTDTKAPAKSSKASQKASKAGKSKKVVTRLVKKANKAPVKDTTESVQELKKAA